MDLAVTIGLVQQHLGHLLFDGAVHQPEHPPLGPFQLAETGHQPAESDDRVREQHREQLVAIEAKGPDPIDGPGRGDVRLTAEHGDVADDRPHPHPSHNAPIAAPAAGQLDCALLDHVGGPCRLALPKEVGTGVLPDGLAGARERLEVVGTQGQVVGAAERLGQPGVVLGLTHVHAPSNSATGSYRPQCRPYDTVLGRGHPAVAVEAGQIPGLGGRIAGERQSRIGHERQECQGGRGHDSDGNRRALDQLAAPDRPAARLTSTRFADCCCLRLTERSQPPPSAVIPGHWMGASRAGGLPLPGGLPEPGSSGGFKPRSRPTRSSVGNIMLPPRPSDRAFRP